MNSTGAAVDQGCFSNIFMKPLGEWPELHWVLSHWHPFCMNASHLLLGVVFNTRLKTCFFRAFVKLLLDVRILALWFNIYKKRVFCDPFNYFIKFFLIIGLTLGCVCCLYFRLELGILLLHIIYIYIYTYSFVVF